MHLNAKGHGSIIDEVHGTSNEQVEGRLSLLANRSSLNDPEFSDPSIGQLGKTIILFGRLVACNPLFSEDSNHPHPTTMVGLKQDKDVEGEITEDFEKKGFTWTDKEKQTPSPFHIPEDDELTGDRKFQ